MLLRSKIKLLRVAIVLSYCLVTVRDVLFASIRNERLGWRFTNEPVTTLQLVTVQTINFRKAGFLQH